MREQPALYSRQNLLFGAYIPFMFIFRCIFFTVALNHRSTLQHARYYPEEFQSSIMSVFRLPLNLLVVMGTRLTDRFVSP
jgi:hypothetical protein